MKRVLIIFMFFVIIIGLFFLPKSYARHEMTAGGGGGTTSSGSSSSSSSSSGLDDILSSGNDWITDGKEQADAGKTMNTVGLMEMSDQLYNILLTIATGVAIIVGAILGIKFMTAGIDQKVQVKEALFPYLISCIVVFGSLGIWKLVVVIIRQL